MAPPHRFAVLLLLTASVAAGSSTVLAQEESENLQVVVLRDGQSPRSAQIDSELLRALESAAGLSDATMSPIQYSEARLSVGCDEDDRACLIAIAEMLEVGAIMVRRLELTGGQTTLTLSYLDTSSPEEPLEARGRIAEEVRPGAEGVVRRLFGLPMQTLPAEDGDQDGDGSDGAENGSRVDAPEGGGITPWTWVALGAGTAALSVGIVLELLANDSFDEYVATNVSTRADADRAADLLDSANVRRTAGVILMIAGGAGLAVGATLLLLGIAADGGSEVSAVLSPVPGGAQFVLAGTGGDWL